MDEHGETQDWVIVTCSSSLTAAQIRSTYELRTAIEERHRQYKCFWDLTPLHSRALSLVINQALFVLLAYTLLQAHLRLRKRQELNRGTPTSIFRLLTPTLQVLTKGKKSRSSESHRRASLCGNVRRNSLTGVQLKGTHGDTQTREAIEDWHYWVQMGYQF